MLLLPRKYKFKKYHKQIRRLKNTEFKYFFPKIGDTCLRAKDNYRIKATQIELVRRAVQKNLTKRMRKKQCLIFGVFPDVSITKKSSGVRMGKGKGPINYWASFVKKSSVICEIRSKKKRLIKFAIKRLSWGGKKLSRGFTVIRKKRFMINLK